MIKSYENNEPNIKDAVFVASSADIIGKVTLGENSNIWYNCVLRGDENYIKIGKYTNIQDGSVVHIAKDFPTIVGDYVTVGHKALIHACTVGNNSLIGMGAIILNGAKIGSNTIIGAGSLVPPNKEIPDGVLAFGNPIKVIRDLTDEEKENLVKSALDYVEFAKKHN
ncbi:gamma carbonic anhydrase family protein [Peptostreptococcaceae bacterium AGR-M142]